MPLPRADAAGSAGMTVRPRVGESPLPLRHPARRPLALLARRVQLRLDAFDGAGVTMKLRAGLVNGCSNAFTVAVDEAQYALMEGPCVEAAAAGVLVRSPRVTDDLRWPAFASRARDLGLRSVVSAPIRTGDEVVGSLNLYSRSERPWPSSTLRAVPRVAAGLGRAVEHLRLGDTVAANGGWLADAVRDRVDVERAVGFVMDRYLMSASQARTLLRLLAHQDDVSEGAAARSVLTGGGPDVPVT